MKKTRRDLFALGSGALAAAGIAGLSRCSTARAADDAGQDLRRLAAEDLSNGGADPFPIPWLDKNGSHNQSPEPGSEPSSIYHFDGQAARCNDFSGSGTDQSGRRVSFGTKSTDFSLLRGEYFAGRSVRRGIFSHI